MDDKLLTVKHAAERLDASPMTVYRLVYANRLKSVPIGTGKSRPRIRIPESAINEFIRSAA